ncbi:MAG: Sensor histidine kinase TodS [Pseudomonadota bacterium]|jgi:excisionase family DNA binding protein
MASLTTPACCGTSKAAELLQLSVGTVQSLVDKNILHAWITEGGHRRISLESLHNYQLQQQKLPALERLINDRLRVMVVDDDAVTRHMLQDTCLAVHAHVDCCAMASAIEALLHLPVFKPHIMFLDLLMPQVDGWEMVRRVKQNENFAQMQIITYSALNQEELQERGGPPKDANFMAKPLDLGWLRGYLLGKMSPQTWA